jgi:hypothetical protein
MNFFFSFKNSFIKSRITIPRFNNFGKYNNSLKVYEAKIEKNLWKISAVVCNFNDDFYFIDEKLTNNESIFFLAEQNNFDLIKNNGYTKLVNFNDFTRTSPVEYRSNFKIILQDGGFSSYQSDYPYYLIGKKGSILSPISNLLNNNNDKNIILFKNIFEEPYHKNFNLFFVDIIKKIVLKKIEIYTNITNAINVQPEYISSNVYIYTDHYIGIPIFISIKNKHVSLEHTHPPHHYILSHDKFAKISEIKKQVHEIINS